jgi:hypothetical protein
MKVMVLNRFITMLLFITGCTIKETTQKLNPCQRFESYICEITGSHKGCWCQDTRQLERMMKNIQQRTIGY